MSQFERLPCATHPKPDELLSSWLTRLAHDHLLKVHTFGKLLFPNTSLLNRDLDKIAPELVLQTLTHRTGTPLPRIRETALRRYEGRLYRYHNANGNTNWLLPLGVYHRTHRHCGLLFCPSCLTADGNKPYFRTHWRLALAQVCTSCGVYLQEKCPSCERPVTFFRVEVGRKDALPDTPISHCFYCARDLATVPTVPASAADLAMQAAWERVLREGWNGHLDSCEYFDVLHQLVKVLSSCTPRCAALQQAVDRHTGWSPAEGQPATRSRRIPFELLPLQVRGGLLCQAHWLLEDWPLRFIQVMKQNRVTSTPLLHSMPEIPIWFYSVVREHLYVSNEGRPVGETKNPRLVQ